MDEGRNCSEKLELGEPRQRRRKWRGNLGNGKSNENLRTPQPCMCWARVEINRGWRFQTQNICWWCARSECARSFRGLRHFSYKGNIPFGQYEFSAQPPWMFDVSTTSGSANRQRAHLWRWWCVIRNGSYASWDGIETKFIVLARKVCVGNNVNPVTCGNKDANAGLCLINGALICCEGNILRLFQIVS